MVDLTTFPEVNFSTTRTNKTRVTSWIDFAANSIRWLNHNNCKGLQRSAINGQQVRAQVQHWIENQVDKSSRHLELVVRTTRSSWTKTWKSLKANAIHFEHYSYFVWFIVQISIYLWNIKHLMIIFIEQDRQCVETRSCDKECKSLTPE